MAGSQNLLTPGPADGLAVGRQGPRSRLCLRTRLLPALTRPPALAGRRLRERGPAMEDGLPASTTESVSGHGGDVDASNPDGDGFKRNPNGPTGMRQLWPSASAE